MVDRWGRLIARRARLVLVVGVLLVAGAAAYGVGVFGALSQGGFDTPGSESARALEMEREAFGNRGADVVAIYSDDDLAADDPEFREAVAEVVQGLPADAVAQVTPYYEAPPEAGLVTADGHAAQVVIALDGASQDDFLVSYEEVEPLLEADGLRTDVAGSYAVYSDVNHQTEEDLQRAELISLPLVILLALVIFGSAVAASMPAMVGVIALVGGLGVVRLLTTVTDVSVFSINVVSVLGIGLAIDYALFVVSRFREELARLPEDDPDASRTAIRITLATAGRTVLFSGLTVAASLASLLLFPQMFLKSMGYGGVAAVLIAMLAALTILPATLVLLGRRIDGGRMPWRRGRPVSVEDDHGRWAALARGVMRRPVTVLALTVVLLLVVASPFLGVKWGSVDHRVLPDDSPSYIAAEKLADFGGETSRAGVVLTGVDDAAVQSYVADAAAVTPDAAAEVTARDGDTALVGVTWPGSSQAEASLDLVRDLQAIEPAAGEALVGGITAETVDLLASVGDHLPWMGAVVVLVMFVLLFVAFGSLVLPLKAVVMNVFSITASFGVVTWIFSDGNLSGLLDFEPQGFLDATNPILMLAIIFGLSMDYEVFLLSRVREQWDATGSNDVAVATGVQKTGRIITSAALLLGVVIGAFSTSGVVFMKMLGVGMLVALLIDATIVRALMVPATMKLLGRWNWWAPAPMVRWWERYGFREEIAEPAVQRQPERVP
ncbi:MMPL family transporter [Nocardioides panacisoli]|uniref:MMPL family transporter n=1 Tax=Nocardioides panacisoli TaxID=627624 RepID=UPI001C631689|nr:MMPL family transporter [Nocardioides panacisoli]QYJ03032.1 MMPL family transporter [Nocardioides panacisoli]